jgi:cytochrome c oxidase cbb3-type subunit 2
MKSLQIAFVLAVGAGIAAAFGSRSVAPEVIASSAGEAVYMAEGCIHCHSQYVRPGEADMTRYGPASKPPLHSTENVLIGNRRQGPDLSHLGLRRSRSWNRTHLIDPQALSTGSRMPSYAYLFDGDESRGEALLDYLDSLGSSDAFGWNEIQHAWSPPDTVGDFDRGHTAFMALCAQCHGRSAHGDGPVAGKFDRSPTNLRGGPFRYLPDGLPPELRRNRLARIVKFGLSGSPMPGHEYLDNDTIADLVNYVESLRELQHPTPN